MSQSDRKLREVSVPFLASVFANSIGNGGFRSDLYIFDADTGTPAQNYQLRIAVPRNMNLAECYLNLILTVATGQPTLGLKIGIGRFNADTFDVATFDSVKVDSDHLKLTGSSSYISATAGNKIIIDGLKLTQAMYKNGDTYFNEDAFVLMLGFDRTVSYGAGYNLDALFVMGSAILGVK